MDNGRGTIKISGGSPLARLYRERQERGGGNKPGYKENLCHFFWTSVGMAIRLLWMWFWGYKVLGRIRPWMFVVPPALVAGYTKLFLAFPSQMTRTTYLLGAWVTLMGILFMLYKLGALRRFRQWLKYMDDYAIIHWWEEQGVSAKAVRIALKGAGWTIAAITIWLWGPIVLVAKYFRKHPAVQYRLTNGLKVVGMVIFVAVVAAIYFPFFWPIEKLVHRMKERRRRREASGTGAVPKTEAAVPRTEAVGKGVRPVAVVAGKPTLGFLSILWAVLVATKKMLCPFIEIVPATPQDRQMGAA